MTKGVIIFETETCVGCRSCELACSYHHKKTFNPNTSSIRVIDRPKTLVFALSLCSKNENGRISCDNCEGLDECYCVKYCSPLMKEELNRIIDNFQRSR